MATGGGGGWRSRTRPTSPVAPSTYHGPLSPSSTPDFAGSGGGVLASNTRSAPCCRRLPLAPQRAWPDCTSTPSADTRALLGTPTRLSAPPPIMRATARMGSPCAGSAPICAGLVGSRRPVRSPTRVAVTKQACGGGAEATSNTRRCRSGPLPARVSSMVFCASGRRKAG